MQGAGISVIQIDEPALRGADWTAYLACA